MLNMLPKLELVPISNSGVGSLLLDACRIAQLDRVQPFDDPRLLERVLDSARGGQENSLESGEFSRPESQRLAFRELGLAIGLQAADFIPKPTVAVVDEFDAYPGLATALQAFWLTCAQRATDTWLAHPNINEVMLATALIPGGVLDLLSLASFTQPFRIAAHRVRKRRSEATATVSQYQSASHAGRELAGRGPACKQHFDTLPGVDFRADGVRSHVAGNGASRPRAAGIRDMNDVVIAVVAVANLGPNLNASGRLTWRCLLRLRARPAGKRQQSTEQRNHGAPYESWTE